MRFGRGLAIGCVVVLMACPPGVMSGGEQFSMREEFEDFYRRYPPRDSPPTPEEQELLLRYAPRFHIASGEEPFLDFYKNYIAHGRLETASGTLGDVTRDILNAYRDDPGAVFTHEPFADPTRRVAYGRIDYDDLWLEDGRSIRLTFLTYNIVFRNSGLPVGISHLQRWILGLVADLRRWHQLDHYVSATITLLPDERPIAVTLQQHNYQRTYILGKDMIMPADGRVALDAAISSNELYPHDVERKRHRCASFMTPDAARWILSGGDRPMLGAVDETQGDVEVDYELVFLPQTDAFYTFRGMLGRSRLLPHRDGPPGADFNTLPALKPRAVALVAFYMRGRDDTEYVELLQRWADDAFEGPPEEIMSRYRNRFLEDLPLDARGSSVWN